MNKGKQRARSFAAWILVTVFLFPLIVQFSHTFQGEDHVICTEKTEHLHQTDSDCPICYFHWASVDYDLAEYPDISPTVIPVTVQNYFSSPRPRSFQPTGHPLRAPPHHLV